MDTGTLHQLHNTGDKDVHSVTNGIDFHFLAPDIVVNKNRLFLIDFHGSA